jgi:hypothetical protein
MAFEGYISPLGPFRPPLWAIWKLNVV